MVIFFAIQIDTTDNATRFGPDGFQEAMKIVHKAPPAKIDWSKFKYMVFDIPNHQGTYRERYAALGTSTFLTLFCCINFQEESEKRLQITSFEHVALAPAVTCQDTAHLERFFQDVVDRGGEGVILRDPAAPLQPGRSSGYLKHKVSAPPQCTRFVQLIGSPEIQRR